MILLFFNCGFPDTPPEEPAVHFIVELNRFAVAFL
jgi:hypothetical protein